MPAHCGHGRHRKERHEDVDVLTGDADEQYEWVGREQQGGSSASRCGRDHPLQEEPGQQERQRIDEVEDEHRVRRAVCATPGDLRGETLFAGCQRTVDARCRAPWIFDGRAICTRQRSGRGRVGIVPGRGEPAVTHVAAGISRADGWQKREHGNDEGGRREQPLRVRVPRHV